MQKKLVRNRKELKTIRSRLRQNMPAPEAILWTQLRGNKLGVKFRRQYSVENNVLDFYAPSICLGIEVDGESHFEDAMAQVRDRFRDEKLAQQGIKVLRFTNRDIMDNLEGVISRISAELPPLNLPLNMGEKTRLPGLERG